MATSTEGSRPSSPPTPHDQVRLPDQTNLLPIRKVIPIFLGLAACAVVTTLDSVIVATALPTISSAFSAGSVISWVPSAYLLTSTSFQPLYGRFSDIFGRKAALCAAMVIFMIGNFVAGFSRSVIQLIVFRGVAGAGGGGIISIAQIIVSDVVSLRDRGKYQGVVGCIVAAGYAVGPLIGGALAQKVDWRWCFWVTLPLSVLSVGIILFLLPLKPVEGDIKEKLLVIDYLGTFLALMACTLVMLPLIWGGVEFSWNSPVVLAPLISGFVVAVLFCIWEKKWARLPIVPMYIFKIITITGVYICMFLNGFVFFSSLYYLPQYFQVVLRYSPIRAGIFLIPVLMSQLVASFTSGLAVSKTGRYRSIIYSGFVITSVGCGLLSTIRSSSPSGLLVFYMLLSGFGSGQTMQTTTVAAQASVPRKDMSVVTAFRNFIRLLGGALVLAIDSTIINNSLRNSMTAISLPSSTISRIVDDPTILSSPSTAGISDSTAAYILDKGYTKGFQIVFILNACLAAVAAIASFTMIRHTELTRADEEQLRKEALEYLEKKKAGEEKKNMQVAEQGAILYHIQEVLAPTSGDLESGDQGEAIEMLNRHPEGPTP